MKLLERGIIVLLLFLTACSRSDNFAPVADIILPTSNHQTHTVLKGETLYAIAWRYDMDYRTLASINRLSSPYALKIGQVIHLKGRVRHAPLSVKKPKKTIKTAHPVVPKKKVVKRPSRGPAPVLGKVSRWRWPAKGKVSNRFSLKRGHKGVDIAGRRNSDVRATAAGIVAYRGQGLRSYGKLIIIKHNQYFLSAYAHNSRILVKEGQRVKAGQVIAEMGSSGTNKVKLHFEIRKAGKPVNPLKYVKAN